MGRHLLVTVGECTKPMSMENAISEESLIAVCILVFCTLYIAYIKLVYVHNLNKAKLVKQIVIEFHVTD